MDQGDLFLEGRVEERDGLNYLGNTHGGMLNLGEDWYIFYHRQTNQHSYSRQACAEKLVRLGPGQFRQAEVTSCGLNGGPLEGKGEYEARIACNLWSGKGVARYDRKFDKKEHPYFTQTGGDREERGDQYIANMRDGSVAGFKYFLFDGTGHIELEYGGRALGKMRISHTPGGEVIGAAQIRSEGGRQTSGADIKTSPGCQALYFRFEGEGSLDFFSFTLR